MLEMGEHMSTIEQNGESFHRQLDAMLEVDADNLIAKGRHNLTRNNTLFFYGKKDNALKIARNMNYDEAIELLSTTAILEEKKKEIRTTMNREILLQNFAKGKVDGSIEYKRFSKEKDNLWVKIKYSMFEEPDSEDVILFLYTYDITDRVTDERIVSRLSSMEYDGMGLLEVKTHQYMLRNILTKIEGPEVVGKGDFEERVRTRLSQILVPEERDDIIRQFQVDNIVKELQDNDIYYVTYSVTADNHEVRRKKCKFTYLDETKQSILYCRSDITDTYRKEQEQLRRIKEALQVAEDANVAKSEFLSRMSHDIRTPMNTIVNLTKMVKEEIDDKEAALEDLKKIEKSNQFLLLLINDILDISRIEQKSIVLCPQRYSFEEFWEYLYSTFHPLAVEKNIELLIEKNPEDVDVLIDKVRFNQICFNLISNAIKYTPAGGHIAFKVLHGEMKDGVFPCDIYVIDDGIGMSKEFQKKMFEPFAQEGRAYKSIEGTGLGLPIVKEIVEQLEGTIEVESEIGKGTTFHICINMTALDKEEPLKKKSPASLEGLRGKQILVVEDHVLNQEIAKRLLSNKGMSLKIVNNGKEALEEFKENYFSYSAILMDMRMPVMDGLTAAKEIRSLSIDKAKQIPIIAMTANAFEEDKEKSAQAGMNAHLAKPINPKVLYETLEKLIYESELATK